MNEVSIAPVGSSDWQSIGHLTEPQSLSLTMENVDMDTMALLYGQRVGVSVADPEPTHAVWVTHTEEVSGRPKKPKHVPGFLAWLKGTNRKAEKAYLTELFRWIGAGKPTKQVEVGLYIPKARIIPNPA